MYRYNNSLKESKGLSEKMTTRYLCSWFELWPRSILYRKKKIQFDDDFDNDIEKGRNILDELPNISISGIKTATQDMKHKLLQKTKAAKSGAEFIGNAKVEIKVIYMWHIFSQCNKATSWWQNLSKQQVWILAQEKHWIKLNKIINNDKKIMNKTFNY